MDKPERGDEKQWELDFIEDSIIIYGRPIDGAGFGDPGSAV